MMRNILKMVCIALCIYYVCPAPTLTPLEQIINELITLRSVTQENLPMKSVYPNNHKKTVSIEELSCRAKHSIEALESSKADKLKPLLRFLMYFTKDVNCTIITHENYEKTEDMKTIVEQLLKEFRKHFISLEKQ